MDEVYRNDEVKARMEASAGFGGILGGISVTPSDEDIEACGLAEPLEKLCHRVLKSLDEKYGSVRIQSLHLAVSHDQPKEKE
jgi:hypothetical protein